MLRQTPQVCARQGCTRPVSAQTFACAGDWYALPMECRAELMASWRAFRWTLNRPPAERHEARERYQAARGAAYVAWAGASS